MFECTLRLCRSVALSIERHTDVQVRSPSSFTDDYKYIEAVLSTPNASMGCENHFLYLLSLA